MSATVRRVARLTVLFLCLSVGAQGQDGTVGPSRDRVVYFPVEISPKLPKELQESREILTTALGVGLKKVEGLSLVTKENMEALVTSQMGNAGKAKAACADKTCRVDVVRNVVHAKYWAEARVAPLGKRCNVTLTLQNVRSALQESLINGTASCDAEPLMEWLKKAAANLYPPDKALAYQSVLDDASEAQANGPSAQVAMAGSGGSSSAVVAPAPARNVSDDMVLVPAGEFMMGCNEAVDTECDKDEKPSRRVYVSEFRIDRTEVSNEQYGKCVSAGHCNTASYDDGLCYRFRLGTARQRTVGPEFQSARSPVVCVDWGQAKSYCEWSGKRLPTEAEWEKAARGTDGRKYSWGNGFLREEDRWANVGNEQELFDAEDGYKYTAPVGSYPTGASPYGALDMSGNVSEWVNDLYGDTYYESGTNRDPIEPSSGIYRVIRGGSWYQDPYRARASYRGSATPTYRFNFIGFRCASSQRP